jgi:hypothetical protein
LSVCVVQLCTQKVAWIAAPFMISLDSTQARQSNTPRSLWIDFLLFWGGEWGLNQLKIFWGTK